MQTNYHTHHYRCGHATGDIEDYVVEAIKNGYTEIGMSCHVPFENFPEVGSHRMDFKDLSTYLAEIDHLRIKYPQIRILKAFECEYFPNVHGYLKMLKEQTDYLILAGHYIERAGKYQIAFNFTKPEQLEIYVDQLEVAMKTGLFKFLAHPDIFMTSYPRWDSTCEQITHKIAKLANEYNMILELNANGLRRRAQPYPSKEFWSMIAKDYPETKVVINSDCHRPEFLNDDYMLQARKMAEALKLNVLSQL